MGPATPSREASESAATQLKECGMKDRIHDRVRRGGGMARLPLLRRRGPVTAAVVAVALITATLASVSATATTTAASASDRLAYLDSSLPVQARVASLLGQMTLAEKIGQMVQIEVTQVTDTSNNCTSQGGFNLPNPACEQKILTDNHVGSILAGGTDIPVDTTGKGGTGNTGLDWANEYNMMQSYAI